MSTPSVFPATVPGPSQVTTVPAERRLLSDLAGGTPQARGLQRDYLGMQTLEWSLLDPVAAAAFDDWYTNTTFGGGVRFAATWPAPQGWVSLVRKFVGTPRWTHLAGGFWRVTAQVQVHGRNLAPAFPSRALVWDPATSDLVYGAQTAWAITGATATITNFQNFVPNTPFGGVHLQLNANRYVASSGKRYFEIFVNDGSSSDSDHNVGKMGITTVGYGSHWPSWASGVPLSGADGSDVEPTPALNGNTPFWNLSTVMQFAVDFGTGLMHVGKNGSWGPVSQDPVTGFRPTFTGVSGSVIPYVRYFAALMTVTVTLRTQAADFTYAPPSGFIDWAT